MLKKIFCKITASGQKKITISIPLLLTVFYLCQAQSLQHPVIWTATADRPAVLAKIENYSWASSILTKAKASIDDHVNTHLTNPDAILNTIPALASDDNLSETAASSANSGHSKVLNYAAYAGMLYHTSGEEKYAQFAADILWYYIEVLSLRRPDNTAMSGSYFYDSRCGYLQFAMAYDFVVNFLQKGDTQVYQKSSGSKIAFDNVKAQKAVHNIAMNGLGEHAGSDTKYGKMVSNHPVLTAPGVLFSILCVEDDTERERMFNIFWNVGTKRQNSFTKTILPMFGEQGIWPESVSYGFMQNITLVLNLVDRLKPELNVMNSNMHILDGNFMFDNLRHPNRRFVTYGDSHRDNDGTGALYRYTLNLATRKGFDSYVEKGNIALRQSYDAQGGYDPAVPTGGFGNVHAFEQLFWGIDVPKNIESEIDFQKPTVVIKHAGVALQRNYVEENNVDYGLCGIIGGAHYVHSHCSGLTMELYGANYIMAPNGGLPPSLAERKYEVHTGYFWRHAGNNTVIVNGTSHGVQTATLDGVNQTAWNSDSDLLMNTTVNVAAEPKHLENPINPNFSFATQFLNDEINNDHQQRTLSTIRTSETSGYYFDMFRSKSLGTNNFHDYVYHNLGDEMHLFDSDGQELSTSATSRYQSDIGDTHKSPGWRFFENTQVTASTDASTKVRFDLNETGTYMSMFAPGGEAREYTKAVGPPSREARGGYIDKKTQILAVRQMGEAWNKPFVHIFEPSKSTNTSVKSVEHLYRGDTIVGAKVCSQIGDKVVTDYIICQENASKVFTLAEEEIHFTGRFAVVRKEQILDKAYVTLYIGEGTSLSYGEQSIQADDKKKGQLVIEVEADLSRILGFKDLSDNQEIPKCSDLSVEAIVGTDFTEATLWVNDSINLGTITSAPFIWSGYESLSNMMEPQYVFRLVAKDINSDSVERTLTIITPKQWAYTNDNLPHPIPGRIEFEHYDNGPAEVSYYDRSPVNTSKYTYREGHNVDLNSSSTKVVYIQGREWLEYTVNVSTSGNYDLTIGVSERRTDVSPDITVLLPDENRTLVDKYSFIVSSSQSIGNVYLDKGEHVIRFYMNNYGYDLDYYELTKTSDAYKVTFNTGFSKIYGYSQNDSTCVLPDTPVQIDSVFIGWQTADGQDFNTTTKVTGETEVFATWKIKTYNLNVQATNGHIEIDPEQTEYNIYTIVTLSAKANNGYTFDRWTGDYFGTDSIITLEMIYNLNLEAHFTKNPCYYTIDIEHNNGSVTKTPDQETYLEGTEVEITASPSEGYRFTGWSGDVYSTNSTISVIADSNISLTANFEEIIYYQLNIIAENGSVTVDPIQEKYEPGTQVELTPMPNENYEFISWTGDYTGTENPLSITMDSTITITAVFNTIITSVANNTDETIRIYPNPAKDYISIYLDKDEPADFKLYSITGAIIQENVFYTKTKVNLAEIEPGNYIIEITTKDFQCNKNIVILK